MPNCSVVGCDYKKWPKDGTYQSFPIPTEPYLRKKWLTKLNRDKTFNPDTQNASICIRHFEKGAFLSDEDNKTTRGKLKKRKSLKPTAFPTLFLRPEKSEKDKIFFKNSNYLNNEKNNPELPKEPVIIQLRTVPIGVQFADDKGGIISENYDQGGLISETDDKGKLTFELNDKGCIISKTDDISDKGDLILETDDPLDNDKGSIISKTDDISDKGDLILVTDDPLSRKRLHRNYQNYLKHPIKTKFLENKNENDIDVESVCSNIQPEVKSEFKEKDYESTFLTNPWDVSNASVFLKYCCPECDFKSDELHGFSQHAVINHVLSNTLFGQTDLDHIEESSTIKNNAIDQEYDVNEDFDGNFESVDEYPEIVKKYVTAPQKNIDNLSKTAQDIFKKSLNISNEEQFDKNFKIENDNREFHQCSICNISFPDNEKLSKYIAKLHDEKKLFKCSNCYPVQDILKESLVVSNGEFHQCSICNMRFPDNEKLSKYVAKLHEEKKLFKCTNCNLKPRPLHEKKKEYKCNICSKEVTSQGNLNKHIESVHEGKKPYKCPICDATFALKGGMKKHIECVHEGIRPHLCFICGAKFYDQKGLNTHFAAVHEKKKPFECSICHDRFSQIHHLGYHMKSAHNDNGDKPFKCTVCKASFIDKRFLKRHISRVHEDLSAESVHDGKKPFKCSEKPFKCSVCDANFSQTSYLMKHVKLKHNHEYTLKQSIFKCYKCDETFSRSGLLRRHFEAVHDGKKPFKCSTCDKMFSKSGDLKLHIASVHEGKKPFKCSTCNKMFSQSGYLKYHIDSVHEGKKPFKCSICNNSYSLKQTLDRHIASVHEGKREFQCPICGQCFTQQGGLKKHVASLHEGKKPHKCPQCDFRCSQNANLKVHILAAHEGKK